MIVISKKRTVLILTCVLVAIFTFILHTDKNIEETIPTVTLPVSGKTIIIDAGHGVPDGRDFLLKSKSKS